MNSKPPKPNSQVSIYMNHQTEMEIAEKYSNLPYTLKKLQDFTFSEIKFLVGGGCGPPPTSTWQLTILLITETKTKKTSPILHELKMVPAQKLQAQYLFFFQN